MENLSSQATNILKMKFFYNYTYAASLVLFIQLSKIVVAEEKRIKSHEAVFRLIESQYKKGNLKENSRSNRRETISTIAKGERSYLFWAEDVKSQKIKSKWLRNKQTNNNKEERKPVSERYVPPSRQNERKTIIGGTQSDLHRYPYMVTLQYYYEYYYSHYHRCGATLIAPDIVLTAAHCHEKGWENPKVIVGDHDLYYNYDGGESFESVFLGFHPEYDYKMLKNDVALFKLSGKSTKTPIRLNTNHTVPTHNEELFVMGWGSSDPEATQWPSVLREISKEHISDKFCFGTENAFPSVLCVQDLDGSPGEDSCHGDSGGPLIRKGSDHSEDIQVGLVSRGAFPCAKPEPAFYTDISTAFDYIKESVCANSLSPPAYFHCGEKTTDSENVSQPPTQPTKESESSTENKVAVTLVINFDYFPEHTVWSVYDKSSQNSTESLYEEVGGYPSKLRLDTAYETFYLEKNREYEFVIGDFGSDGICCYYGTGDFSLFFGEEKDTLESKNLILSSDGIFKHISRHPFRTDRSALLPPSTSKPSTSLSPSVQPSSSPPTNRKYPLTLVITFDFYPKDIMWAIVDKDISGKYMALHTEGYSADLKHKSVHEIIYLEPNRNYDFMIIDLYGDGLCCDSGTGNYSLYNGITEGDDFNPDNLIFSSHGNFKQISVHPFTLSTMSPTQAPIVTMSPTKSSIPTLQPSLSYSPTSLWVDLTLVFRLDKYPQDVMWLLKEVNQTSDVEPLYSHENGYPIDMRFQFVYESIVVDPNKQYELYIYDSYSDGLCCAEGTGYYFLYWGKQVPGMTFEEEKVVFWGLGNYGSSIMHTFDTAFVPPTMAPTISPKYEQFISIEILFDTFPFDLSWSVSSENANFTKVEKPAGSYKVSASQLVSERVYLPVSVPLIFKVEDYYGDGLISGFVKVYKGPVTDNTLLFEINGAFRESSFPFMFEDSKTIVPTMSTTSKVTSAPTLRPSSAPTNSSANPSSSPTRTPTSVPTNSSAKPSSSPSLRPTGTPTIRGTLTPSGSPSSSPSLRKTSSPKPTIRVTTTNSSDVTTKPSYPPSTR